jgi:hypothetical protein
LEEILYLIYSTVNHNFSGLAERPTRHQDLSEFFQTSTDEQGDELRDELRDERRDEVRDEQRDELRDEQRDELRDELSNEQRDELRDELSNDQRDELSSLMTLLQDKNRQGGIVGLFETISKLHADTGNNFSVTRHLQQDETGQLEEDDENSKKPGMSYWTTWTINT